MTSNTNESIADNAHCCNEVQNDAASDAMQIANEEDARARVNCAFVDITDGTDRSCDHRLKLINETNIGKYEESIKGLLEKIVGRCYTANATNKKNMIKWLEHSPSKMPQVSLKKSQLQ